MSSDTKAQLGYRPKNILGSVDFILDDPKGLDDDGNFYLCIPADEARGLLEEVIDVCTYDAEGTLAHEAIIPKARALLALIPKEENDGAEV